MTGLIRFKSPTGIVHIRGEAINAILDQGSQSKIYVEGGPREGIMVNVALKDVLASLQFAGWVKPEGVKPKEAK